MAIDFSLSPELEELRKRIAAFIVDLLADGWTEVRQIETMHGSTGNLPI